MKSAADYKKIIQRRDARFDGRFYFGVKTTGIYCRPVCPAKPKPENILIFKSSAEAESAGYRPCLRCRPDCAPGSKLLDGTLNTVSRALRIIESETPSSLTLPILSTRLGVSERHLRRLFEEHLGASPVEILISQKLHLARRLIVETPAPLSEIAFAAGFQSLRRFNEAFKKLYQVPPSKFRKSKATPSTSRNELQMKLPLRLPYDFQLVLNYLKRHSTFGIERATEKDYTRFIPTENGYGQIHLKRGPKGDHLLFTATNIPLVELRSVLRRLRNLLDLDHNPEDLPKNPNLKSAGVRVPGSFDAFETVVGIVLCQLVSTEHAKTNLKQLVETYGTKIGEDKEGPIYRFPEPSVLQDAPLEKLGLTRVKAGAIREISRLVLKGELNLSQSSDLEMTRKELLKIKGFGPWTVEIIAMRCLGDSDAFPKNDLVINRAIENLKLDDTRWASSRAYLTHCLWRDFGAIKK